MARWVGRRAERVLNLVNTYGRLEWDTPRSACSRRDLALSMNKVT